MKSLTRRAVLFGGAGTLAAAATGCDAYNTLSDRTYGSCSYKGDILLADGQTNCWPAAGTPADLAWSLRAMRVPQAWQLSECMERPSRGFGTVIGHVDTGVAEHDAVPDAGAAGGGIMRAQGYDFIDRVKGGYDPLINHIEYLEQIGHGTATASVIVGRGELEAFDRVKGGERTEPMNGDDPDYPKEGTAEFLYPNKTPVACHGAKSRGRIVGVAPAAGLVPVRAFRVAASSRLDRVTEAVEYLTDQKVHVITMALGWAFPDRTLTAAIKRAIGQNILVLAAAGNFVPWVVYPAREGDAIAVAGLGPDDRPWCGGSTGKAVTISAYGDRVWRAYVDEKTNRKDIVSPRFGTSFAVSMTSGVAALWLSHHGRDNLLRLAAGQKTLQEVFRAALQRTARKPLNWSRYDDALGAGIVDAESLLRDREIADQLAPRPARRCSP